MARRFLDPENSLWTWMGKIPDMVGLSLLTVLFSLPLVTLVPALVALYDAVFRCLVPDEKGTFRRFFRTFRNELKGGIPVSLLWLVAAFILWWGFRLLTRQGSGVYTLLYQVSLLIPVAVFLWTIILESRFVYSFGALHKNAFLFTLAYLPKTALLLLLLGLVFVACWYFPPLMLIAPAALAALQSIPGENVLQAHTPASD